MNHLNNPSLTSNAQTLRKGMTKEERKLWYEFLKPLPVTWNRQKVIGKYIVDFCCASAKLIIELDGAQHYEGNAVERDKERDAYLTEQGYTILRYTNIEFHRNFKGICEDIWNHLYPSKEQL